MPITALVNRTKNAPFYNGKNGECVVGIVEIQSHKSGKGLFVPTFDGSTIYASECKKNTATLPKLLRKVGPVQYVRLVFIAACPRNVKCAVSYF